MIMNNLRESVETGFSQLTKGQKSLVQKILCHYEDYIFLSVDEAAKALDVHKSTLVRLAQSIGYGGYIDLRRELQALYQQEISPSEKLGKTLAEVQPEHLYQQVIETEKMFLDESLKTIEVEDIHAAAALLIKARRIFICGRGPQAALAKQLEFRLRRFGFDVQAITDEGRAILEQLHLLAADDVLIVFSFIDVPQEHRNAISLAVEIDCPVILITDPVAKEMVDHVTVVLAARRGPATIYHTNMVPLAIITAIVLDVARLKASDVIPELNRLQDLRRQFGYEYTLTHHEDDGQP